MTTDEFTLLCRLLQNALCCCVVTLRLTKLNKLLLTYLLKNVWGITMQNFLQARCRSCHPTNNVKAWINIRHV